jgi:hypothetical protein
LNSKSTVWLVALAAALLAFVLLFERHTDESDKSPPPPARLFPDFNLDSVTRLEVALTNKVLRVERAPDKWTLTVPVVYPAAPLAIEGLLRVCAQLRPRSLVPAREIRALAAFGLDPPQAVLRVWHGKGQTELRVGFAAPVDERLYVQVAGLPGVAVVDARLLQLFPRSVDDWRDRTLLDLKGLAFDRIRLRAGPREVTFQQDPAGTQWRITSPPPIKRVDEARLAHLLRQLHRWPVQQFVTDDPKADLERFGLQLPEAELAFGRGANDLLVVQFGKSPTNDSSAVFVRRLSHTNVVLATREALEQLRVPTWELRDHHLVDPPPAGGIDSVEVNAAESFALRRQTNGLWRIAEPFDLPADTELVEKLFADLRALEAGEEAREVVTDYAPYGLAPPARRYSLFQTVTNAGGAITNQLFAQLDFGSNHVDHIFARRHDEISVYVAPLGDAERLPQAAWQLRDRRVWNFSASNVVSVTVSQKDRTRKLTRTGARQWTADGQPLDEAKGAALEEGLARLGQLQAQQWNARGAAKLAGYGIPDTGFSLLVELNLGGAPQTLTIAFGRAPAKRNPYASVPGPDGEPVVFEFPLALYQEVILPHLSLR